LIRGGRVSVNGRAIRDPEFPVAAGRDVVHVDGQAVQAAEGIYLMLNKPRGLVTTAADEQGRDTVFTCFAGANLPFLSPVGRLDQASEGLLLFSNDTAWAARISAPESHVEKTYHVQVDRRFEPPQLRQLEQGRECDGELLRVHHASLLRAGEKNCWLKLVLDEGRNRHLRRLLGAMGIEVMRLVRVAMGPLTLGSLAKGQWRHLTPAEVRSLREAGGGVP
jgi:23S rRNA pseudouridine2605 synthase